jgi:glycosyl transferase family 2
MNRLARMEQDAITFVITSCGRFDLLERCLARFLEHNTAPIKKYILVEDSGDTEIHRSIAKFPIPIEVIVNTPPVGQVAAIDRAYKEVRTPYIFHCEDDWVFFRSGFIEESLVLLKHDQTISTVLCRRPGQNVNTDSVFKHCPVRSIEHIAYRRPNPWLDLVWFGYSFNPGLRRLSDYRSLGSFSRLGQEGDVSLHFKFSGMTVAVLANPACETIGQERRLPKQAAMPSLRARWRSIRAYLHHALSRSVDW